MTLYLFHLKGQLVGYAIGQVPPSDVAVGWDKLTRIPIGTRRWRTFSVRSSQVPRLPDDRETPEIWFGQPLAQTETRRICWSWALCRPCPVVTWSRANSSRANKKVAWCVRTRPGARKV